MGLELARIDHSDYVMFVDADDLVNRGIARLCEEDRHPNGWLIDRGYRMDETTPWIAYRRRRFNQECGSSYILRTDRAPFPPIQTTPWILVTITSDDMLYMPMWRKIWREVVFR